MTLKDEIDKIFENSNLSLEDRYAEIQAKYEKDCAEIDERHRKADRILKICIVTSLLALGFAVFSMVSDAQTLDSKNDACVEAGGVFVRVYGGFKCYRTDLRQELTVE